MTADNGEAFVLLQGRPEHHAANLTHYLRAAAGHPVRETLAIARRFLVHPPGMQSLQ